MSPFTLQQLQCFDAVAAEGSFQAAADKLHRSHPTVFTAVKNLEGQLGVALLDRDGYRVALTGAGRSFHARTRVFLAEAGMLQNHATQLAMGQETELSVVLGDLCPIPRTLALLRRFFDACPGVRLNLHFEAISGPWERLLDGAADLIIHHIDQTEQRFEYVSLMSTRLIPVVAPRFLAFPVTDRITPEQMRDYPQCIIRDTARGLPPRNHYVIEGARGWSVADQLMKKEVIMQGMGWGHMPDFLVDAELRSGRLLSFRGRHFPGGTIEVVAARLRHRPHGPVAQRLWQYIGEQASLLHAGAKPRPPRAAAAPKRKTAGRKRAGAK